MEQTDGVNLLLGLLNSPDGITQLLQKEITEDLFNVGELEIYKFMTEHASNYGKLPSKKTLKENIDGLLGLKKPLETIDYYLDKLIITRLKTNTISCVENVANLINTNKVLDAFYIMQEYVATATLAAQKKNIINVSTDMCKIVYNDYISKLKPGQHKTLTLGWPTFDNFIGGIGSGDFIAFVGRPGSGKTYKMLSVAHHLWKQNKVVLFISMEMLPLSIIQRFAAIETKVPVTGLKKGQLSNKHFMQLKDKLEVVGNKCDIPFWCVDGNLTATAIDVVGLTKQLKPDIVIIDGAYMLQSKDHYKKRWEVVSEGAEILKKQICHKLKTPVIGSYQFNKEAAKMLRKGEQLGLDHIGGSEVIGQIASIVLGLMEEETIENLKVKKIDILKGRDGERGSFYINWIFDQWPFMDFSEVDSNKIGLNKTIKFI